MAELSAVVFVPDDTAKTGLSRPMMLQKIMGTPLLGWLAGALRADGVGRFFLVCHERFKREARGCFPSDVEFFCPSADQTSDELHVFLSTADEKEDEIVVVTGPAVMLSGAAEAPQHGISPVKSCVSAVNRQALMEALDDKFIFTDFLRDHGTAYTDRDGVYSVCSMQELADWQPILSRMVLLELAKQGVEIWDYGNTYVDPGVAVGAGTAILPGTVLRGQTLIGKDCVIGPNSYLDNARIDDGCTVKSSYVENTVVGYDCHIGPFANVRPGSTIGAGTRIGSFAEIKNSVLGDGVKMPHFGYVGDSDVGKGVQFGAGAVTANFDRVQKSRTAVEDDAFIGSNVSLIAPVRIGQGSYTAAGSTVTEDVPPQALAIDRVRQVNKKDWAQKHKQKEPNPENPAR